MDVAAGSEKWSKFKAHFFLRLERGNYFGSKNKSDCMPVNEKMTLLLTLQPQ